jgi:mRNA interferase MazF
MKRGDVYTLRDEGFASKARPVVIVQDEDNNSFNSVILCLMTTFDSELIETRVRIDANSTNGLKKTSYVMTDKIVTVRKDELGPFIGRLADSQMHDISRELAKILHITKEDLT